MTRRAVASTGAAFLVCVLLLLVLEARLLRLLPDYAAVGLVFLALLIVPGWFLQRALLRDPSFDFVERFVVAFSLGIAIAAPSGLMALWFHLDLQTFMRMHVVLAGVVTGASVFFQDLTEDPPSVECQRRLRWEILPLAVLVLVVTGGVLASPIWPGDRLERDFDDWVVYMPLVTRYVHEDGLRPLTPARGQVVAPRLASNVWLVIQASVAKAADVPPEAVLLLYLPPLLTVMALGATYALAKRLFGNVSLAVLAVAFLLGYAFLDLSPAEGFGRNLLSRISEDKMVATYILFPVGLLLIYSAIAERDSRFYGAFALLTGALFVVHPQALLFLVTVVTALAVVRVAVDRSREPLRRVMPLAIPLAIFTVGQFLFWRLFHQNNEWFAGSTYAVDFHGSFKILDVPGNLVMGNYHMILHPLMLGSIILFPIVWLRSRKVVSTQVLLAATVGWLPWFFLPPLSLLLARFASASLLWRLPYMVPVSIVIAYLAHDVIQVMLLRVGSSRLVAMRLPLALGAPVAVVALTLGGAILIQELYLRADDQAFYQLTDTPSIVPGTESSIFLGGVERLRSSQWRVPDEERKLLGYLERELPTGSAVLAPDEVTFYMPGMVWGLNPVPHQEVFRLSFGLGGLEGRQLADALEGSRIDYVVVSDAGQANAAMHDLSNADWLIDIAPYSVFEVR